MDIFVQQLFNGLTLGAVYGVVALGYTMVYGIIQLINFAHGEVVMIGAMVAFTIINLLVPSGLPPLAIVLIGTGCAVPVCMLVGYGMERLAYRPLRHAPRLAPLITAIGVSLLLENAGQLVFGADPKFFPALIQSRELVRVGGVAISNIQAVVLATAISLMAILEFVVMRTRFGRAIRAVSYDAPASGKSVAAVKPVRYALPDASTARALPW